MEKVREKVLFALQEVQRAVIGKQEVTETVMKAFLAGGHVLVEDIPGLGKTTMAIAFPERSDCRSAECSLHRMYFRQI